MRHLSARGIATACTAAAAAFVLAAPGTAMAKENPLCATGVPVEGQGASTQKKIQQEHWNGNFDTSGDKWACGGPFKPTVKYNSTGSGAGLRSWGIEEKEAKEVGFGPTNAYVGTDEPPNATQIADFEAEETTPTAKTLLTIPVMQVAVAAVVHLPSGCKGESSITPGRLVLSQKTLEGIFAGTVTKFGEIKDSGDKVVGASKVETEACEADAIQPVVRQDQSGTTHIFKRFLNLVDTAELETESGKHTWGDLSEGSLNTTWPTAAKTVHAAKSGGGELVKYVAENAGTVGYASLADARANTKFGAEGGETKETFWAEIQNGEKKGKVTYNEPSTNGENGTQAAANCAKTLYSDGASPFPPPSVTSPWNQVTSKTSEKTYVICGFSFDLSTAQYSLLPGSSSGEADTVKAYLQYVTDKKGGQPALNTTDYESLPKSVMKEAFEGAGKIGH